MPKKIDPPVYELELLGDFADGDGPILLTQEQLDILFDVGERSTPEEGWQHTIDFATLKSRDGGPVLRRGVPLSDQEGSDLLSRAMIIVLQTYLASR